MPLPSEHPTQTLYDEEFGQTTAFPLSVDDVTDQDTQDAYAYLAAVKQQALSDTSVYFSVRARDGTAAENVPVLDNHNKEADAREEPIDDESDHILNESSDHDEKLLVWQLQLQSDFQSLKTDLTLAQRTGRLNVRAWPGTVPSTGKQWRTAMLDTTPPPLAHFFSLDHATTVRLTVYATKWLSTGTRTPLAMWIWCLLLRLDTPLDANDTAIVRELGQKALNLWFKTNGGVGVSATARHAWAMVVTIVGSYYRQSDLKLARKIPIANEN